MPIIVTPAAAEHIQATLLEHGQSIGIRIGTRNHGCAGYTYVVNYADSIEENDSVFYSQGITIIVDNDSLPLVDGTEIDFYKTNLFSQGLEFYNPNVKHQCDCGESFSVE
ncbi:iron-sulfur cluster assembly accessory protein [Rhodoferax sp. 4810]|uniref:Iron-sulfur cluster assembly accessory protein n=1 Tax=Thiospirillum jenense TaxID=1653858 RepID=A0A839HBS9_9GAMM|nr:iron-sulfur cluster assembly accessory protein [Thiospirillum jenense]MBB1073526.1 iron-sulfur cluster assembly accessory protein [Rhodoferax jenense]MBB1126014.1 iron-sulfur cluster assembly accessory protein [Thiospirillum jenense]